MFKGVCEVKVIKKLSFNKIFHNRWYLWPSFPSTWGDEMRAVSDYPSGLVDTILAYINLAFLIKGADSPFKIFFTHLQGFFDLIGV